LQQQVFSQINKKGGWFLATFFVDLKMKPANSMNFACLSHNKEKQNLKRKGCPRNRDSLFSLNKSIRILAHPL